MDNLTHSLVGVVAAKAGLERASRYAMGACIAAANAPDVDIVTLYGGRWSYLENHRGITHSIAGTLVLSLVIPSLFYLTGAAISHIRGIGPVIRFRGLLLASLLLCASHPLLDLTNSYGLRPFLPWSERWYYGDLLFIADPWLWLILGAAAFLTMSSTRVHTVLWIIAIAALSVSILTLRGSLLISFPTQARALWLVMASSVVIARLFRGTSLRRPALARLGLGLALIYLCVVAVFHNHALTQAVASAQQICRSQGSRLLRVAATPEFGNPFRWNCFLESDTATSRFEISTREASLQPPQQILTYEKPRGREQQEIQEVMGSDSRAQIFMKFARFPVFRIHADGEYSALQIADLRFARPGNTGSGSFALEIPLGRQAGQKSHP